MIAVISIRYPQYQDQLLTGEGGHLFTHPVNTPHTHDVLSFFSAFSFGGRSERATA